MGMHNLDQQVQISTEQIPLPLPIPGSSMPPFSAQEKQCKLLHPMKSDCAQSTAVNPGCWFLVYDTVLQEPPISAQPAIPNLHCSMPWLKRRTWIRMRNCTACASSLTTGDTWCAATTARAGSTRSAWAKPSRYHPISTLSLIIPFAFSSPAPRAKVVETRSKKSDQILRNYPWPTLSGLNIVRREKPWSLT